MTSSRHIEFLGYLPDGTRVPNANSSSDCDGYHTRTIGPKGRFRKLCGPSFVPWTRQLKAGVPGRDVLYET